MGRRRSGALPEMRLDGRTGHARVRINGKTVWLGRWGSAEAQVKYDGLIAAYVASGRKSIEAALAPPCPAQPAAGADLTVAELSVAWLASIKESRPDYKRSSQWHSALAVTRAVLQFAAMPAKDFGSKALLQVQKHLIDTPIIRRKKKAPKGKRKELEEDPPPKFRTRRYINDVVAGVRQMFNWGVRHELLPDDRVKALSVVDPLAIGQTRAREGKRRRPVKPSIVKATLPFLTPEMADLVWFIRLTGCRPSEARRMRIKDVRPHGPNVWRYSPRRHKTRHKGKRRHIAIGPKAYSLIKPRVEGRDPKDYVFTPQRSIRRPVDSPTIPIKPRKPSPRAGKKFSKNAITRAVRRAAEAAGLPAWTPYQLRYLRLREARRGSGRETARSVAGHSRAEMTDHYAPPEFQRAARWQASHG